MCTIELRSVISRFFHFVHQRCRFYADRIIDFPLVLQRLHKEFSPENTGGIYDRSGKFPG